MTTPKEVEQRVLEESLAHPCWGCDRLRDHLRAEDISVSAPTVQKVLNRNGLGTRHDRWLKLEDLFFKQEIELSDEQVAFIEEQNPCFRQKHLRSSRPGELLIQDSFFVGSEGRRDSVFVRVIVDPYSSYTFGFLDAFEATGTAVDVLCKAVPFYSERELNVELMLTDSSLDYDSLWLFNPSYLSYLNRAGISQRTMPTEEQPSGFIEYFERAALDEYFWEALESYGALDSYDTLEALRRDFDSWLNYYNTERPHHGYPNIGKRPIEMIDEYLKNS